jgi:hypothetical protein
MGNSQLPIPNQGPAPDDEVGLGHYRVSLLIRNWELVISNSVFLVLLFCGLAVAQVPMRDYIGEEVTWHNARMLASGGLAGLEPGPAAVFGNPALLGFVSRPALALSYGLKVSTEVRTRIVYDQFENALGEVAIADNVHGYGVPGPIAGAYRFGPLAVGAGLAPVRDFSYSYYKEYRDDFYVKFGEDRVQQTGALYNGSLGLGYRPVPWLSVGATGGYVFGSRRLETWAINGADTVHFLDYGKPAGIGFSGGLVAEPLQRLRVGADFQSGVMLNNWSTAVEVPAYFEGRLPWSARLGLSYRVPGSLPSVATVETKYQAWHGVDNVYSNVLTVRAGVEHTMLSFARLRYGFGVEPMPFDPTIQRADIGMGLGFDAGPMKIDFGLMMTRDIIGPGNFYTTLPQSDLKIHESRNYFSVSISREF